MGEIDEKRKETEAEHKYNGQLQTLGEGRERKGREQTQMMRLTYGDGDGHIIFRDRIPPGRRCIRQGPGQTTPEANSTSGSPREYFGQLSHTRVVMGPTVLNHFGPGKGKARDMAQDLP